MPQGGGADDDDNNPHSDADEMDLVDNDYGQESPYGDVHEALTDQVRTNDEGKKRRFKTYAEESKDGNDEVNAAIQRC